MGLLERMARMAVKSSVALRGNVALVVTNLPTVVGAPRTQWASNVFQSPFRHHHPSHHHPTNLPMVVALAWVTSIVLPMVVARAWVTSIALPMVVARAWVTSIALPMVVMCVCLQVQTSIRGGGERLVFAVAEWVQPWRD